jgi:outer membrane receptor protein involved in Fe transport
MIFSRCGARARNQGRHFAITRHLLILVMGVSAGTAHADDNTSKASHNGKTEEIVVTAQKRSEVARKVPVSVSVLSGAKIKSDHIQNFADLTRSVPNLSFSSQAGEGLSTLELRGVSSEAGTATVAVYLDDVSLTTRNFYTEGTAEPRFLDIANVEVLRGPQGTLYGASALGGTLKYISNKPQLTQFSGNIFSEISGTYHGGVNWDEQGMLNIPLAGGKAALRIAGEKGEDSGYITQINGATDTVVKHGINSNGFNVGRVSLLMVPNDWLTITPQIFWQKTDSRDSDAEYLALPNFQTPKVIAEPGKDELFVPSLTVQADLGFATLTSTSSIYQRSFVRTNDSTAYNNLAFYLCDPKDHTLTCSNTQGHGINIIHIPGLYNALNDLPSGTYYNNQVRQYQQEVRLTSAPYDPLGGGFPLTWIGGIYVSDEYSKAVDYETVTGASQVFAEHGINFINPDPTILNSYNATTHSYGPAVQESVPLDQILFTSEPGSIADDRVFNGIQDFETTQYAVFGEATYHPTPTVRLTFGGRYLIAHDRSINNEDYFYAFGINGRQTSVSDFDGFTPKIAFGWDITPVNTLYINISRGVRLGSENRPIAYIPSLAKAIGTPSFDLAMLGLTSVPTRYSGDSLWNYEIGDKGRFFGGRLVASADVFLIKWQNIQTYIPLTTSGLEFETNAGNATSYGGEFELRGRVTDSVTAGLSGSVTHATLTDGVVINGAPVIGTFAGEDVPGVPHYNFDFDVKKTFAISDTMDGFVSADIPWVGESHGVALVGNADYKRPSYITMDAVMGFDWGRWEFTLFGKNLSNNNKIIQRPDIQGSGVDTPGSVTYGFTYLGQTLPNTQGFTLRPLTVGFNASAKF